MTCLVGGDPRVFSHQQLGIYSPLLGRNLNEVGSTVNRREETHSLSDLLEITASKYYGVWRAYRWER